MDAFNFRKPDAYKNVNTSQIKEVEVEVEVEVENGDMLELENKLKNMELDNDYCIIL